MEDTYFPKDITLKDDVILITGGSGFLGQHIIRVLQERANGIKEIRVVDVVPFVQKLAYVDKFPLKIYSSDITAEDQLDAPYEGATVVVHTVGVVDIGHFKDRERMFRINVTGTKNVLRKCQDWNIRKFIFTSTSDADTESEQFRQHLPKDQEQLPLNEKQFLMGYYAYSKALAEEAVLNASKILLRNGKTLKSVIIRPICLYGELDPHFLPKVFLAAKKLSGYFPQLKMRRELGIQSSYAGNVAWTHALAIWRLNEELEEEDAQKRGNFEKIEGQAFNIADDSPFMLYEFLQHFLAIKGYSLLKIPVPLGLVLTGYKILGFCVQRCPDSWKKFLDKNPLFSPYPSFKRPHSPLKFNRQKAMDKLHYKPIYDFNKAFELCTDYYRDFPV
ncbi:unnamed protein product [Allacma fusca]|uniref:3-beta hydroxysteroid dehydrogenase/isomerase domain-containing protein n=1 Tax=Allacma fusca TaxID=39272 RepID=A0A8J2PS94_9HEXA|nr:unnamed protein product [Allacma fusca]